MATNAPTSSSRCERCNSDLPPGKTSGHCPRCLLELAMGPERRESSGPGGEAPSIEDLQPLFPAYEMQVLLGRGGMGAVYRARHRKLDRLVAIKVLLPDLVRDPAFEERFEREARALAILGHPGIVGVHDFGRAGDFFFLVMEFVDGASLRDLLQSGRLSTRDVLTFVPQLCDALQYAHDHGVVHRDIKPENILVDQDGRVRIADFGLAKLVGKEASKIALTRTEQALGTPLYMAPEQIGAAGSVDHRADLYSLGVVVYEMLTGTLPIGRFEPPSAKARDARAFDPVVMRSLANDPAQRYQQARDVKHDVEAASTSSGAPVVSALPGPILRPRPWIGSVVILCATFAVWVYIGPGKGSSLITAVYPLGSPYVNAWNASFLRIPMWFVLPLALAISSLSALRAMGYAVPPTAPLVLAAIGAIFCGLLNLAGVQIPGRAVSTDIGPLVAGVTFAWWVIFEVRAMIARIRGHRRKVAANTAGSSRRTAS
ncbi:MAG: serine/threonine protein kinase [Planctomycetes bacterium]|nr:serine/threonine protein kinase [Planctomycetota bacterium]